MFFVNDQQAQVFKIESFLDQTVGAYDDIKVAGAHFRDNCFLFLCCFEARDGINIHWPFYKTVFEGFGVLLSEQGGRYKYRYLLAGLYGDKCSSHSNFSLAKPDIPAN